MTSLFFVTKPALTFQLARKLFICNNNSKPKQLVIMSKTLKNANLEMFFTKKKVENDENPLKRRNSRANAKIESPAPEEKDENPLKRRNSRANAKTEAPAPEKKDENPLKRRNSRANAKTEAPAPEEKDENPLKRRNSRANAKTEAPAPEEKDENPLKRRNSKENSKTESAAQKENENPPKRRSARLTRNTNSMAEDTLLDGVDEPEEPKKRGKLPFIKYRGKIEYFTEFREIAEASDLVMQWVEKQTDKEIVPMAFDMEWPFSFQTGPGKSAVIQICVEEQCCYIFQLTKLKTIPPALIALLNHPKVRLHGVNIKCDFRKLARDFSGVDADVLIEKCVDLGVWYNKIKGFGGRWSLERLTNVVMKKGMDKSKKIRMSKWHVIPLDENQLMYAAIDVYIGHIIYQELEKCEKIKLANEKEFVEQHGDAAFKAVKTLGETFLNQKETTETKNIAKSLAEDLYAELKNDSMDE